MSREGEQSKSDEVKGTLGEIHQLMSFNFFFIEFCPMTPSDILMMMVIICGFVHAVVPQFAHPEMMLAQLDSVED